MKIFELEIKVVKLRFDYKFPPRLESNTITSGPAATINSKEVNCKTISKFMA
jgi:hypothetical protein